MTRTTGRTQQPARAGLSVGEAARAAGVSIDTLRYYEREQLLRTDRTASGHRRYSARDLEWISVLTCLRETGCRSAGCVSSPCSFGADDDATIGARIGLLEAHREQVRQRIGELEGNLAHVEGKITWYRDRLRG